MTTAALNPTSADWTRRDQILDTAALVFARSGVRTSLKEIADACSILPGSLYHHFASRDAIVVELVERYETEINALATTATDRPRPPRSTPADDDIVNLSNAIAQCAIRHRAALFLTMYDRPASTGDELVRSASVAPPAIVDAMLETLRAAQTAGALRADVDATSLAERLCQSMLDLGAGMFHGSRGYSQMPTTAARLLLDGLAEQRPKDATLDRSPAFKAAQHVIARWPTERDRRGRSWCSAPRSRTARVRPPGLRRDDDPRHRGRRRRQYGECLQVGRVEGRAAGVGDAAVCRHRHRELGSGARRGRDNR